MFTCVLQVLVCLQMCHWNGLLCFFIHGYYSVNFLVGYSKRSILQGAYYNRLAMLVIFFDRVSLLLTVTGGVAHFYRCWWRGYIYIYIYIYIYTVAKPTHGVINFLKKEKKILLKKRVSKILGP